VNEKNLPDFLQLIMTWNSNTITESNEDPLKWSARFCFTVESSHWLSD